jgi:hypothetical protein
MTLRARWVTLRARWVTFRYAYMYDVAVVVTNHVRDMMDDQLGSSLGPMDLVTSGKRVAPSLGLLWSSCVNMRVFLAKLPSQVAAPHSPAPKKSSVEHLSERPLNSAFLALRITHPAPDTHAALVSMPPPPAMRMSTESE